MFLKIIVNDVRVALEYLVVLTVKLVQDKGSWVLLLFAFIVFTLRFSSQTNKMELADELELDGLPKFESLLDGESI